MGSLRKRFLVIGGGKMGEALIAGWIASDTTPASGIQGEDIEVVEPGEERRAFLSRAYGVSCIPGVSDALIAPDVVVLAVKPQVMMGVLSDLAPLAPFQGGKEGPLFISIAAGLSTEALERALPSGAPLVRVMPNMPLSIGAGASAACAGKAASRAQLEFVSELFGCLGRSVIVSESEMDVVCALSGSGPAYVAAMIEALRDAAAGEGLESGLAEALALQTVLGTARLIDETGASPADTRVSICSPGGTTLAALDAMGAAGFDRAIEAGVAAAVERSTELARCS